MVEKKYIAYFESSIGDGTRVVVKELEQRDYGRHQLYGISDTPEGAKMELKNKCDAKSIELASELHKYERFVRLILEG